MSKRLPPFSADQLLQSLRLMPEARSYMVGFSGGADSTALLHALISIQDELAKPVRAVHVNHALHPQADDWQKHCDNICRAWSVDYTSLSVKLEGTGKGLEAEARELRYAALQSLLIPGECLLTAHHADDQAETLLLNLLRGSGVDGLSAMPKQKRLGNHWLLRPLLDVTGESLRAYLKAHEIEWLEDPSNSNSDQDRNFIRLEVLPLLESRFRGTTQRLLRTQQSVAESRSLLETMADQYLQDELPHAQVLNANKAMLKSPALFKLIIRRWLSKADVPAVPGRPLNDLYVQMAESGTDQRVAVSWADCSIRVYQDQLFLHQGLDIPSCKPNNWPEDQPQLDLGDGLGQLELQSPTAIRPTGAITVTNRQANPELSLARPEFHQSLKNLFQAAHIPVWLRDSIPLTLIDDELVAIGDWSLSTTFASWLDENHVKFTWQPDAPVLQYVAMQQHNAGTTQQT